MQFFECLENETQLARQTLVSTPILLRAIEGDISLIEYVNFLSEAYHHVKHTTPLLMAVGSRLPEEKEWLREAVAEYIKEELGHQEWILNDIAACGFNKEIVRDSLPAQATELMVAYAYDMVCRISPIGFFGMVHVLEGTSINMADCAAKKIAAALDLPDKCFSYLRSHGALDIEHVDFFTQLMNKISDPVDQQQIIHSANMFYHLYGNIFRSLRKSH